MPFWSVEIRSPLSETAVLERMRGLIRTGPRRGFWAALEESIDPPADAPPFEGEVSGRTFRMTRIIRYRNSFLPVIRGEIAADVNGGTTLRLRMTLHWYTMIIMAVWLTFVGQGLARIPLRDLSTAGATALVPVGLLLFAILLTAVGFFPEARKAERLIRRAVVDLAVDPRI